MVLDILDTFDVSKYRIRKQEPSVARPHSSIEIKTRDSIPQRVLLTLGEVPKWYDINPFILTGYRHQTNSLLGCLASWTYLHNESGNIYSHLIPAVAAIFGHRLLYNYLRAEYANLRDKDWTIISLQLWAALACMSTSTMYHTMICHSPKVKHSCLMYDYVGIIAVMLGNFISGIYFGFYCEPRLRLTYWILVTTMSLATGVVMLNPRFHGPKWRRFRMNCFLLTGFFASAPMVHGTIRWGREFVRKTGVRYYLLEVLLILVGCFFYEVCPIYPSIHKGNLLMTAAPPPRTALPRKIRYLVAFTHNMAFIRRRRGRHASGWNADCVGL